MNQKRPEDGNDEQTSDATQFTGDHLLPQNRERRWFLNLHTNAKRFDTDSAKLRATQSSDSARCRRLTRSPAFWFPLLGGLSRTLYCRRSSLLPHYYEDLASTRLLSLVSTAGNVLSVELWTEDDGG